MDNNMLKFTCLMVPHYEFFICFMFFFSLLAQTKILMVNINYVKFSPFNALYLYILFFFLFA